MGRRAVLRARAAIICAAGLVSPTRRLHRAEHRARRVLPLRMPRLRATATHARIRARLALLTATDRRTTDARWTFRSPTIAAHAVIVCPAATPVCNSSGAGYACSTGCANPTPNRCSNSCVNLSNDPNHCGACGTVCSAPANATATCAGGCGFTCTVGYHLCGSTCASNADVTNCGASCSPCAGAANGMATCDGNSWRVRLRHRLSQLWRGMRLERCRRDLWSVVFAVRSARELHGDVRREQLRVRV